MKNKVESVVIVYNNYGAVATMRFTNPKDDRIVSSPSKTGGIYTLIERHVEKVTNV